MNRAKFNILIVGGGSSGWMTAALLGKTLPHAAISLIESSDVPIIGVGESTNVTMRHFLRELGYDERSFMRACDASLKLAIRFENFNHLGGVFYHPFGRLKPSELPIDFLPGAQENAVDFPVSSAGNLFSPSCSYSYQLDAGLFAEYLKKDCKKNGTVHHIVDHLEEVRLAEDGSIAALQTLGGLTLTADLYVDCTGFRSLLLSKTLQEPFIYYNNVLLNDRAVAARAPYCDKRAELVTHTNCTAMSAGWIWKIPLWSRIGMGYVYSSKHLSEDEAELELRNAVGGPRGRELQVQHLKIRTGRHARSWVKNCVAIGISFGFLEPLESTGLSLTQLSIRDLANALSSNVSLALERDMFNSRQNELLDSTRDFILAHYLLTTRADTPYWKDVRNNLTPPDTLVNTLADARARSYKSLANAPHHMYGVGSWNCILSGMGFYGQRNDLVASKQEALPPGTTTSFDYLQENIFKTGNHALIESVDSSGLHPQWYPTS